jgi:hypothetical protein
MFNINSTAGSMIIITIVVCSKVIVLAHLTIIRDVHSIVTRIVYFRTNTKCALNNNKSCAFISNNDFGFSNNKSYAFNSNNICTFNSNNIYMFYGHKNCSFRGDNNYVQQ